MPGLQTSGSGALLNTVQRKGSAGLGGARSAGGGKDAVRAAELEPFLQVCVCACVCVCVYICVLMCA